jgi:hypothetical protein
MKSCKILLPTITSVMMVGILGTSSGCRSTTSWSPTGWFAGRQPDAATLAGRTGMPQLPSSPSLNHTPNALASKAAESPGPESLPTAFGERPVSSLAAGNGSTEGSPRSSGAASLAARANGYQTGPYGMSASSNTYSSLPTTSSHEVPARTVSTSGIPNLNGSSGIESAGFPSPYGGSFTDQSASNSRLSSDRESTPTPGLSGANTGNLIGTENSAMAPPTGFGPNTPSTGASGFALPDYPTMPNQLTGSATPTANTNAGGETSPSQFPPMPSMDSSMSNFGQNSTPSSAPLFSNGVAPPASAYQPAVGSGNFAPGTTGRSTNYNFGSGVSGSSPSGQSLPANTATGGNQLLR